MSSSDIDSRMNAIVASLSTPFYLLMQSVRPLNVESGTLSTEENVESQQSRALCQRSGIQCSTMYNVEPVNSISSIEIP